MIYDDGYDGFNTFLKYMVKIDMVDITDITDIVGAFMVNRDPLNNRLRKTRPIVWDKFGQLFLCGTEILYKITDIRCTYPGSFDPFALFTYDAVPRSFSYNDILTRIEDIYGMSIEEFSLGQLDYE